MSSSNNQSRISEFPLKLVADSSDKLLAWSNVSNLDVLVPVGNLFSSANINTLNLVVNGQIIIGNSTVNLVINSTYAPGTVGSSNLNPSTDALYTIGNSSNRWGSIYSNNITLGDANSVVVVNSSTISLGNSSVNATLNSTSYSGLILNANNANFVGGVAANSFANITNPNFIGSINVGANVQIANDRLFIGNSTISSTINSTVFSGLSLNANNASFFGGQLPSYFANVTAPNFANSVNIGGGVFINSSVIQIGTGSINSSAFSGLANDTTNFAGQPQSFYANVTNPTFSFSINIGQVGINTTAIDIGNSSVNAIINSTYFTGVANNANNLNGHGFSYFANVTNPSFSQSLAVGANVTINTSALFIGNSTQSVLINSSSFTGTANNATNFGGNPVSFFANVTNPTFSGSVNVGSNLQINTSTFTVGNSTVNSTLNSTSIFVGGQFFSNQTSTFLPGSVQANGSLGTVGQVLTSGGLSSNAYWANGGSGNGTPGGANTQLQFNKSGVFAGDANLIWNPLTATLGVGTATINSTIYSGEALAANVAITANNANNFAGHDPSYFANVTNPTFSNNISVGSNVVLTTNSLVIGNATVNSTVNATSFSGTALNANNLGLIPAASYQLNSTLAANVAKLTSNNANNFAGQPQSFYANATSPVFSTSVNVGTNVSISLTGLTVGNSSVNSTTISANNILVSNLTVASLASGNTIINSSVMAVGGSIEANGGFGTAGQVLVTSGAGSNVYWANVSGGSGNGTPGGANAQIQINESGTFGGDANLNWYTTSATLSVGNSTVNSQINSTTLTINNVTTTSINVSGNTFLGGNVFSGPGTFAQHGDINPVTDATYSLGLPGNTWIGYFANVTAAGLTVGNSTVNSSVNATSFSGQANDSLNLAGIPSTAYQLNSTLAANVQTMLANDSSNFAGQPQSFYANVTNPNFTASVNVGANVQLNTSALFIGNSTTNLVINSTTLKNITNGSAQLAIIGSTSNIVINSTTIFIGNSTVNTTLNSTSTGNGGGGDATTLGGHPASYFANVTSPNFSSFITVGNSTVNASVNSTIFSGTANNATNLNGIGATSYQLNSTLAANVATMSVNNSTNFAGQPQSYYANITDPNFTASINVGTNVQVNTSSLFIGNSTVNSTINSTTFSGTSNNATNFGGNPVSFFANVTNPTFSNSVIVTPNVTINGTSVSISNGTATASLNNSTLAITHLSLNAGSFGIAGQGLASGGAGNVYWSSDFQFNSTLAANVAGLTANNANNLGGLAPSAYANVTTPVISGSISVGSNVVLNTAGLVIGNSTVNVSINSTTFSGTVLNSNLALVANNANNFAGQPQSFYANVTAPNFSTSVNVGANVQLNTSTLFIGNSTVNSIINSTYFTGTASNANTIGGLLPSAFVNSSSPVFTSWINVGSNVNINTSTIFLGNLSSSYLILNTTSLSISNLTVNADVTFLGNVTTGPGTITQQGDIIPYFDNSYSIGQFGNTWLGYFSEIFVGNSTQSVSINSAFVSLPSILGANGSNGTAGQVLTSGGTGNVYWATGGSGTPGGANTQLQFNNSGVFAGDANLTWNVSAAILTIGNSTVNTNINSSSFVSGPTILNSTSFSIGKVSANIGYGTAGQVLTSGGPTSNIYWSTVTGGTGTPTGVNTNIQFNNSGSFGGDANLNWISPSATLAIGSGTSNVQINTSTIALGNTTVNSQINSTTFQAMTSGAASLKIVGASSNASLNATTLFIGNSLASASLNSTVFAANTNGVALIKVNGTSSNAVINSTTFYVGNSTANLTLNSSSFASNVGYQQFPSGMIMQWGSVATLNTTSQSINFPIPFVTNAFSIQFTGIGTNAVFEIVSFTKTAMSVNCSSATSVTGTWLAVGA